MGSRQEYAVATLKYEHIYLKKNSKIYVNDKIRTKYVRKVEFFLDFSENIP